MSLSVRGAGCADVKTCSIFDLTLGLVRVMGKCLHERLPVICKEEMNWVERPNEHRRSSQDGALWGLAQSGDLKATEFESLQTELSSAPKTRIFIH